MLFGLIFNALLLALKATKIGHRSWTAPVVYAFLRAAWWRARNWSWTATAATLLNEVYAFLRAVTWFASAELDGCCCYPSRLRAWPRCGGGGALLDGSFSAPCAFHHRLLARPGGGGGMTGCCFYRRHCPFRASPYRGWRSTVFPDSTRISPRRPRVLTPGSEFFHPEDAERELSRMDLLAPACDAPYLDGLWGRSGPVPEPTWSPYSVELHKPGVRAIHSADTRQNSPACRTCLVGLLGLARSWHWPEPSPLLHPPALRVLRRGQAILGHGPSNTV